MTNDLQLLRLPEVTALTRISVAQIYRRMKAGTFPRQVKLGPKTSAWVASEVHAWLASRLEARDSASAAN